MQINVAVIRVCYRFILFYFFLCRFILYRWSPIDVHLRACAPRSKLTFATATAAVDVVAVALCLSAVGVANHDDNIH